jgi:hypothetical protein
MYIEDLIRQLALLRQGINSSDLTILHSFSDQFLTDTGFTEKQCGLALRILNRYYPLLSQKIDGDVSHHLTFPKYRLKIRKSVTEQTVKILKDRPSGDVIEVRFPFSDESVGKIRKFKADRTMHSSVEWDRDSTAWLFNVSEQNIQFLMDFCSQSNFTFDEEFQRYVDSVENTLMEMEKYAPMLVIEDGSLKIKNSSKNMPEIDTDDIVSAIFQARNMGVTLWDDNINTYLNDADINPLIRKFLQSNISKEFKIDPSDMGKEALRLVITHCSPTMVIIPGGSEELKMLGIYNILQGCGIADKDMSVLFRLPNETGKKFNDFVKNQGLNGPISEETKIVFVSTKLPKPLIKSGIKFNSVINMGYPTAHYTLKEYTNHHQNFINFGDGTKREGFDFVKL